MIGAILAGVIVLQAASMFCMLYSLRRMRQINDDWVGISERQLRMIRDLNEKNGILSGMLEQQNLANARQSATIIELRGPGGVAV